MTYDQQMLEKLMKTEPVRVKYEHILQEHDVLQRMRREDAASLMQVLVLRRIAVALEVLAGIKYEPPKVTQEQIEQKHREFIRRC